MSLKDASYDVQYYNLMQVILFEENGTWFLQNIVLNQFYSEKYIQEVHEITSDLIITKTTDKITFVFKHKIASEQLSNSNFQVASCNYISHHLIKRSGILIIMCRFNSKIVMKRYLLKEDTVDLLPFDLNNEIVDLKEILYIYRSQNYQVMVIEQKMHFINLCIDYLPEVGIRFQCNIVARLNKWETKFRVFLDMNQEESFMMIFLYGQ